MMPSLNSKSLRLLLVEDDLVLQKIVLRLLKGFGHGADIANDGIEAVQMASATRYDIIFMDLNMPRLGGVEAARQIIQQASVEGAPNRAPIILAMTAAQVGEDLDRCRAAGIVDCVPKPVQLEILRRALQKWAPQASVSTEPASIRSLAAPLEDVAGGSPRNTSVRVAEPVVPPVDLQRLRAMTDGDHESIRELARQFFGQIAPKLEALKAAVETGDKDEVRQLAHFCAGSSATCGMTGLVTPMRELEDMAYRGEMSKAPLLLERGQEALDSIRLFLSDFVAN